MVKRQKEKQYQSATEHRLNSQLRSNSKTSSSGTQRLPFHCCALTLNPFTNPVCTTQGIIFENTAILPHIMKHKSDPVTGKPMTSRDLIRLKMEKDEESGKWICPVLNKPFSNFSKVVAINLGNGDANVYSYEAVEELNLKAKNYEDLTSGQRFNRKTDLILLQDPKNEKFEKLRDINNFAYVKEMREKGETDKAKRGDVKLSLTASRIMDKLKEKGEKRTLEEENDKKREKTKKDTKIPKLFISTEDVSGVKMTSGRCSGSLTSTIMAISNENDTREATKEEVQNAQFLVMKKRKMKGYAKLHTNLGDIDLELHCDIVPRTTTNFLGLAEEGFYNGSVFHRSIKDFMIQGGKPTGGKKEKSFWGAPFQDEFDDRLKHVERGVLSMANAGPGTNKCQFFVTFKSCPHLDRKHSIFGRVINGFPVLKAIEDIPTDGEDRPRSKVKIISVEVLKNAAKEAEDAERIRIQEKQAENKKVRENQKATAIGRSNRVTEQSPNCNVIASDKSACLIGRYLPRNALHNMLEDKTNPRKKKEKREVKSDDNKSTANPSSRAKQTGFGDFSSW